MKDPSLSRQALLKSHGLHIEPEALDQLVEEAVERLPRGLFRSRPRHDLTSIEARILEEGGFELGGEDLGKNDPLARTAAELAVLLADALTTATAAKKLGVEPSRIRQRLTADPPTLYGIRLDSGWRLPTFQFDENGLLPGFAEVVAALDPELHPTAVSGWFTAPNPDLVARGLDERPLAPRDWLRLGFPPATLAELAADL